MTGEREREREEEGEEAAGWQLLGLLGRNAVAHSKIIVYPAVRALIRVAAAREWRSHVNYERRSTPCRGHPRNQRLPSFARALYTPGAHVCARMYARARRERTCAERQAGPNEFAQRHTRRHGRSASDISPSTRTNVTAGARARSIFRRKRK